MLLHRKSKQPSQSHVASVSLFGNMNVVVFLYTFHFPWLVCECDDDDDYNDDTNKQYEHRKYQEKFDCFAAQTLHLRSSNVSVLLHWLWCENWKL